MVNDSSRSHESSGEREQPFRRHRGRILSAGLLLALAALGGCTSTGRGDGDNDGSSGTPASSPPASHAAAQSAGGSARDDRPAGCHTDDSDQAKPTAPPKDFRWKALGNTLVPVSKTAGPLKFDGPVWSCYAHTPMGAVLAAHGITSHLGFPGWRQVVEQQMVAGPGRDAFIADRSKTADEPLDGKPNDVTFAGFSVLSYNEKQTTLTILGEDQGHYGALSVTLQWQDGDWKVLPDPDGTIYSGTSQVDSTNGFVTWGPVT